MTEPATFDAEVTPFIILGGKKWPIPELGVRQLRRARRLIIDVTKAIDPKTEANGEEDERAALQEREACASVADQAGSQDVAAAIRARSTQPLPLKIVHTTGEQLIDLPDEDYGKMCDAVFIGLSRAHPEMKREEFESMSISDAEMYLAFLIVRRQSNIFMVLPEGTRKEEPQGEAKADVSQTGTA